jgi:hypothetical protein
MNGSLATSLSNERREYISNFLNLKVTITASCNAMEGSQVSIMALSPVYPMRGVRDYNAAKRQFAPACGRSINSAKHGRQNTLSDPAPR